MSVNNSAVRVWLQLLTHLLLLETCIHVSGEADHQLQLLNDLFRDYNQYALPVKDPSRKVTLEVDCHPILLENLNEKQQLLTMFSWLTRTWTDERLTWNESEYGGIKFIFPHQEDIWSSDMVVENSGDSVHSEIIRGDFLAKVSSNGYVYSASAGKTITTCRFDMTYFPFDRHKCVIKFANWAYTSNQIQLINNTYKLNLSFFTENAQWHLEESYMSLSSDLVDGVFYEMVLVTLGLKRKPIYDMLNYVVPSAVLAMMSNLMFLLPPEAGERISLGITVLLSFSVFQFMIMDKMPDSSDSIPVLTIYLVILMAMSSCSLVISVAIINKYHHRFTRVPRWLAQLTCEGTTAGHLEEDNKKALNVQGTSNRLSGEFSGGNAEEWKVVLERLDGILFYVFVTFSIILFFVVFVGVGLLSHVKDV